MKKQQLLPADEKRKVGESIKKLTTELQQRTSTLRKLIEEHQKQKKREEEASKVVGTSKIPGNSGEFKPPSLRGASSISSSKAERLESDRVKAKQLKDFEIQRQRIEMERALEQDRREREHEQKRMDIEANAGTRSRSRRRYSKNRNRRSQTKRFEE